MQSLNIALFHAIGAGFTPHPQLLTVAASLATQSTWLCFAILGWAAWRRPDARFYVLASLLAAAVASVVVKEMAHAFGMPRPFMLGLSPSYIPHGARGGMPSAHAAVMFTVSFVLMLHKPLRNIGWLIAGITVLTSWARVYVGVHFPFDVAAGALFGAVLAGALHPVWPVLRAHAHDMLAVRRRQDVGGTTAWLPRQLVKLSRQLADSRVGLGLAICCAAMAVCIGLATPDFLPLSFLLEGGPVENGTVVLYLAAAALVVLLPLPALARLDKLSLFVVLVAFAAREADLHSAMFGMSILKARFYNQFANPWQIAAALAMLAPLTLSILWLFRRFVMARSTPQQRRAWWPVKMTALTFMLVIVVSKTMDRLPASVVQMGLSQQELSLGTRTVLLSLEELLEFALPLLAILAVAQVQLARRHVQPRRVLRPTRLVAA